MDLIIQIFSAVKWIFILADLILVVLFIYAFNKAVAFRPNLGVRAETRRGVTLSRAALRDQWESIVKRFSIGTTESMKLAIIDADKFIDYILKESGYQGEHMADRMEKLAPHGLSTFDRLWRAHRIRNQIVHSPDFEIPKSIAEKTMNDYAAFLREVKILEK